MPHRHTISFGLLAALAACADPSPSSPEDAGAGADASDAASRADASTSADASRADASTSADAPDGNDGSVPLEAGSYPPPPRTTPGLDYYVALTGSDSNPGTKSAPFRTIMKAASVASAGYAVHVADGTYNEAVHTNTSGTKGAYAAFVSDTKWGAKVVSPATGNSAAWQNDGDYVAIIGFDVTGGGALGINLSGSGDVAAMNHVHHIPAAACDGYGGTGIGFDQYNVKSGGLADANLVHDIGPLGTNCFRVQGVYTSIPGVTISNNVVYRVVGYAITNGHCSYDVNVLNNTLFANGGPVEGGGTVMTGNANCAHPSNGNVVANNIVYGNVIGLHEEGLTTADVIAYTNNLVSGNQINWGAMTNSHVADVSADPRFVSYQTDGSGDYRLKPGSSAIDNGSSTYGVSVDFEGSHRPYGAGVDIGAYEWRP